MRRSAIRAGSGRSNGSGPQPMPKSGARATDGKGVIVAPIAFVSEHSETLVELDIEYAHLAASAGVADYLRVPTVGTHAGFVEGLADLVERSAVTCGTRRRRTDLSHRLWRLRDGDGVMMMFLSNNIHWIKAFHVFAVIAWMAGCSICRDCSSITPKPRPAPRNLRAS